MLGIPLGGDLAPVVIRVASTSSTESASGGYKYDSAQSLCNRNDVKVGDHEMPARINTEQINVEKRHVNRTVSNNNESTNQRDKE